MPADREVLHLYLAEPTELSPRLASALRVGAAQAGLTPKRYAVLLLEQATGLRPEEDDDE